MSNLFFRFMCLIGAVLLGILGLTILVRPTDSEDAATVFALVTNRTDKYLVTFRADEPGANIIYDAKRLPSGIDPDTLSITHDGKWLFARGFVVTTPTFDKLYYTGVTDSFPTEPIDALWRTVSGDSQYLFYAGVDATGYYETFNLIRLATKTHIEFLVAPLVHAVSAHQAPSRIPKNLVPMYGWTLKDKRLIFTNYITFPCCFVDVRGFASVDLSGIDLEKSGTYPLPPIVTIPIVIIRSSAGVLSPDGEKFAYIFDTDPKTGNPTYNNERNSIAIHDLSTGERITFTVSLHETISQIFWSEDGSSLIYVSSVNNYPKSISKYDTVRHISTTLTSVTMVNDLRLCGNTVFTTSSGAIFGPETLYSHIGNEFAKRKALFSADSIELLSCALSSQWNTANIKTCSPFCTPTPLIAIGQKVDVTKLVLSSGDPNNGKVLYTNLYCGACHSSGASIEPFKTGIVDWVRSERLKTPANSKLTVEQYLAQSIIAPSVYVAPSFSDGIMPKNFGDKLTLSQLQDLVAFLETQ